MSEYTVTFQVGDAPPKTLVMPVEAVLTIAAREWSVSQEATFAEEPDKKHTGEYTPIYTKDTE